MSLTIQILVKNNQSTIAKTLDSLVSLEADLVIGNLGCTDKTLDVCRSYGAKIVDIAWNRNYSEARNRLISEEWNLYLNPWEILVSGHDEIRSPKRKSAFYLQVFQGDVITKEIRYWHGSDLLFQNPVFETINNKNSQETNISIYSLVGPDNRLENYEIAKNWADERGTNDDPHYYVTCALLSLRRYKEFIGKAEQYLLRECSSKAAIMLRYYLAQVELHVFANTAASVRNVMACIVAYPTMAEFWCLLGDILYRQRLYDKARVIYENALILGSRRSNLDHWPIEVPKYKTYPEEMIRNIRDIKKQTRLIGTIATK